MDPGMIRKLQKYFRHRLALQRSIVMVKGEEDVQIKDVHEAKDVDKTLPQKILAFEAALKDAQMKIQALEVALEDTKEPFNAEPPRSALVSSYVTPVDFFYKRNHGPMPIVDDIERECLKLIPHEKFSFAKIWLLAAQFEIRQLNLKGARLILGNAIGKAPKDKIFKKYIEIELQLGNIDRCRKLYKKYLECAPENCYAWSKYAELERSLSETERARSILELAIAQPALDMPELWN